MIAMTDHYDRLETRSPSVRESVLFRDLRHILTVSKPRAAALRAQLKGVEIAGLSSRDKLAAVPVIRQAAMIAAQAEKAPLGGFQPLVSVV